MKLQKLLVIFLALCMAGCSAKSVQEPTSQTKQTVAASDATEMFDETLSSLPEQTIPAPEVQQPEPSDADFVLVKAYIPNVFVELRYASRNNFTGNVIYNFTDVWLRYGTVKKLMLVQEELNQRGLCLKIWDGFRPPSAQFRLWEVCPNPVYVANPNSGYSTHSCGNTVDITLALADGTELVMPTGFDDFSTLADRNYSDCSDEAATNAVLLEQLMVKHGFNPYYGGWWHFSDTQSYLVETSFEPVETVKYLAGGDGFISMLIKPGSSSDAIIKIASGEQLQVMAYNGEYALIRYNNLFGYVQRNDIHPDAA